MNIKQYLDPIKQEEIRNNEFLHLTANEAQMSETARMFLGSKLSERYYMGGGENNLVDLGAFTALGLPGVEALITKAEEATKEMLHAQVVNLNCLSGVHAMMCAILSTTKPGDAVMNVDVKDGGHFATPGILERVGRKQIYATFDQEKLQFDVEKTARDFHDANAKAIYLDVSYYLNPHNLIELRAALGDKAIIIYDASHTMGLILGKKFQDPLREGADVICANTHKTLPGPQKGMIVFKDKEFGDKANAIINGSLFSSPHTQSMIALATTLLEMHEFGKDYAEQIISNSNAIAQAFVDLGYEARKANTGRYSENHQAHIFIDNKGNRMHLFKQLIDNNISTNFDTVLGGRTFIRIGTQELTRRGMNEEEMKEVAQFMHRAFQEENVKDEVTAFNKKFPSILYSFDKQL